MDSVAAVSAGLLVLPEFGLGSFRLLFVIMSLFYQMLLLCAARVER